MRRGTWLLILLVISAALWYIGIESVLALVRWW